MGDTTDISYDGIEIPIGSLWVTQKNLPYNERTVWNVTNVAIYHYNNRYVARKFAPTFMVKAVSGSGTKGYWTIRWFIDHYEPYNPERIDMNRMLVDARRHRDIADRLELQAMAEEELIERLRGFEGELVIFFRKMFNDGYTYTYAAVRYQMSTGLPGRSPWYWTTTGPSSPKMITTENFVNWLLADNGVEEIWIATEFEELMY